MTEEILTAVIRLNEAESCIIVVGEREKREQVGQKEEIEGEHGVCRRQIV